MKTILLIEDNNDIRKNIVEILSFANYRVLDADNGKTGVQLALEHKPDLVVCDIMMPVMDGYSVINILQKNPETQHIPFIFLTAKTEREEMRKGMNLGADDYITKPFEEVELLDAIEQRLKKVQFYKDKYGPGLTDFNSLVQTVSGEQTLSSIISQYSETSLKKKFVIYSEHNHPIFLYYIIKGRVRTYKVNDDGKELTLGLFKEGDFFGYTALLEAANYKENAETLEDSEIIMIPKKIFDELMTNNEVLKKFTRILAGSMAEREQQLLDIAYNSVRKKVAVTLVNLYSTYPNGITLKRELLASMAGIAKETATRTLTDFTNEKIIHVDNNHITILDLNKLKNMFN